MCAERENQIWVSVRRPCHTIEPLLVLVYDLFNFYYGYCPALVLSTFLNFCLFLEKKFFSRFLNVFAVYLE